MQPSTVHSLRDGTLVEEVLSRFPFKEQGEEIGERKFGRWLGVMLLYGRRSLGISVPTMAIEKVLFANNTSIVQDEVLAHRLGLIPIRVDPRLFKYSDKDAPNENNTIVFRLHARCERGKPRLTVKSEALTWLPNGSEFPLVSDKSIPNSKPQTYTSFSCSQDKLPEFSKNSIGPKDSDIILARLGPGQEIELEAHAVKGMGKTHAKWSPVATAWYRMLPEVLLLEEIEDELAEELKRKCPVNVFDIEDIAEQGKDDTLDTIIKETKKETEETAVVVAATEIAAVVDVAVAAAMEKLLHQLHKMPTVSMGLPSETSVQPSGQFASRTITVRINQICNRSRVEVGESSTHSKPIDLSMYSKSPITSFPNLSSNYITSSMTTSTTVFLGEKLNGQNYFSWSQSIKMFLEGRQQFGFLTGEILRPSLGDAQERFWRVEDSFVRFMLISSMEPQIGKPLLYAATSKDLWDTTQKLYSKHQNAFHLYTLRKQVHECKQGTLDVTSYFNKLFTVARDRFMQRDSLNPKYDIVCSRILSQGPLSSLMEVCHEVRLEEDRTNVMSILTTLTTNSSAFGARSSIHDKEKNSGKQIPICEHCKKQWHTKDQCWELHGRPSKGSSAHFVSYTPCVGNEKIQIANGSSAPIAGEGQIDLSLGRIIGAARHSRGLHILDDDTFNSSTSRASLSSFYFSTFEHDFLLFVAVNKDLSLYQLDVKKAFSSGGSLHEPPLGFEVQFGQQVCKFQKSLYGLKQSSRAWFDRFTTSVKSQGYSYGHSDHTLFTKRMNDEFEIKDLGNLKYFLGMEVARSKEGMLGCRPLDTPIVFNCKLIYLSHTRHDISFTVSDVNQFMHVPYEEHMIAINKILRYLKTSLGNLPSVTAPLYGAIWNDETLAVIDKNQPMEKLIMEPLTIDDNLTNAIVPTVFPIRAAIDQYPLHFLLPRLYNYRLYSVVVCLAAAAQ
ncbi:DNA-directed RNA polymerases I and III subunit RPAC1 [Cucumis melo var. makuwa]|uniref:DNA-directed RNA polymerases I and III subunit RPAC1 n=1 Tax=Cucumis melo var. makuwa TaxID=1194695 RepID=A0A5A7VEV7_CUCMM|nr:DNA-directed RNA polymerases I and III subunit RPAC1 [Cucumis melo var. makuwa]TYK13764.1 DNA-directed RNA polymerases I and III subunit RPAC1 [Cucumis melo var. makuwa]